MARIYIRKGAFADLPLLSISELGYCTDTKGLYIGNGISNTFIGANILDEDDLGSDSSISLATQQSIKSYIDNKCNAISNRPFWENDIEINESYTITIGKNAMTTGPINIDANATITVPPGSTWTII